MEEFALISFIKTYSLENIKYKLLVKYLLNVTDILFTIVLLSTGLYLEANVLMAKAVESLLASFILKILFPAVLLICLYIRMKKANETQLKKSNIIINIATAIYSVINLWHLICVLLLGLFLLR